MENINAVGFLAQETINLLLEESSSSSDEELYGILLKKENQNRVKDFVLDVVHLYSENEVYIVFYKLLYIFIFILFYIVQETFSHKT